jgi:hypothetical protein
MPTANDHFTRADRWRARADELRSIAETMEDNPAKRALLNAADDWIAMADQAERLGKLQDGR